MSNERCHYCGGQGEFWWRTSNGQPEVSMCHVCKGSGESLEARKTADDIGE